MGDSKENAVHNNSESPDHNDELGTSHAIGINVAMRSIDNRLSLVERRLDCEVGPDSRKYSTFLESLKIIFSGWPALGIIFILLFYAPLRDALNVIPEKVRSAIELSAFGVSLKSTVNVEARRMGVDNLPKTLPKLSSDAIELLLRAPKEHKYLVSYVARDDKLNTISMPNAIMIEALSELQSFDLITLIDSIKDNESISVEKLRNILFHLRERYPGREVVPTEDGKLRWWLTNPVKHEAPYIYPAWKLTEFGIQSLEVILKAVKTSLSPKNNT